MIFTELFMICTITILLSTNAYIPTFIMLFISPLLGSMIAGKISKKCKSVVFKETFNRNFIIINIIIHILIYFFNFQFNIIMVIIYGIGAFIGFFCANKTIKKFKENMKIEESDAEVFTKDYSDTSILWIVRKSEGEELHAVFNFSDQDKEVWMPEVRSYQNLVTGRTEQIRSTLLPSWSFLWLKKD